MNAAVIGSMQLPDASHRLLHRARRSECREPAPGTMIAAGWTLSDQPGLGASSRRTPRVDSMAKFAGIALNAALLCSTPLAVAAAPGPQPQPLPLATPAAVGLSTQRLEHMTEHFRAEAARQSAAGYVLMVARNGKLAYSSAVGMRDREHDVPMTLDTRFRIASMTKPVTSVAVLMLYEEGRFQLDDPVSRYLPEFSELRVQTSTDDQGAQKTEPAKRPITIRHLLTHTAGLGYGPAYDSTSALGKAWAALNFSGPGTLADKVRAIAGLPLYYHPGDAWRYSYADDVLGRLVEVVSGLPFDRFLKMHLFDPLGMRHTGFYISQADLGQLAVLYRHDAKGDLVLSDTVSAQAATDASKSPSGGGGLISTAGDYLRFAQMLANGGSFEGRLYLSPVTVALMTSNQVPDDAQAKFWGESWRGFGYGLGVGVVTDGRSVPQASCDGDYSWGGFFDTHWITSPRTGIVAVLLTQVDPRGASAPQRTDADFHNLLFASVSSPRPLPCLAH